MLFFPNGGYIKLYPGSHILAWMFGQDEDILESGMFKCKEVIVRVPPMGIIAFNGQIFHKGSRFYNMFGERMNVRYFCYANPNKNWSKSHYPLNGTIIESSNRRFFNLVGRFLEEPAEGEHEIVDA